MFLDTSIIIEILAGRKGSTVKEEVFAAIGASPLYFSAVQFAEIADICMNNGEDAEKRIRQVKDIVSVTSLDDNICLQAAAIKLHMRKKGCNKFSLVDGIVLASARSVGEKLLTLDTDFRMAKDAFVMT